MDAGDETCKANASQLYCHCSPLCSGLIPGGAQGTLWGAGDAGRGSQSFLGLTSVCTMAGLCVRSIFTVWKMSTTPSYRIRSSTMLSAMNTPVLPTPALSGGGVWGPLSGTVIFFGGVTSSGGPPALPRATHLQCTEMGPSWPNCSLVLCTWPMKSMKPSPDFGTPCSGQSVNWNCRTVRDWPSCEVQGGLTPLGHVPASLEALLLCQPRPQPSPTSCPPMANCPAVHSPPASGHLATQASNREPADEVCKAPSSFQQQPLVTSLQLRPPSSSSLLLLLSTHPGIGDLELPQDVLRHVVLRHGVHHEVLVAGRTLGRPVLVTFLLFGGGGVVSPKSLPPRDQDPPQQTGPCP